MKVIIILKDKRQAIRLAFFCVVFDLVYMAKFYQIVAIALL
jgi:hypothetical protein